MQRRNLLLGLGALALSACGGTTRARIGANGLPMQQAYQITPEIAQQIPFRMLDGINTLRQARGVAQVQLNAELNAAAATHARDMAVQNRPWHFGSDGSSPLDRLRRVGYPGNLVGEAISETFETEIETLGAWMEEPGSREVILDPDARFMGLAWFQEPAGKIWWALVLGT